MNLSRILLLSFGIELPKKVELTIEIGIIVFSLLLFALSISAYRKTGMKKLALAAVAFAIFAVNLLYKYLQDTFQLLNYIYSDILTSSLTLAILVLFFLAIARRR